MKTHIYSRKLILVGEKACGKTQWVHAVSGETFGDPKQLEKKDTHSVYNIINKKFAFTIYDIPVYGSPQVPLYDISGGIIVFTSLKKTDDIDFIFELMKYRLMFARVACRGWTNYDDDKNTTPIFIVVVNHIKKNVKKDTNKKYKKLCKKFFNDFLEKNTYKYLEIPWEKKSLKPLKAMQKLMLKFPK